MKNALILHGTNGHSKENWFDWLKIELEKQHWRVWVPNLPGADYPNIKRYNDFLLANSEWHFTADSIIVGHSSGSVALLGLLQALPNDTMIDTCYLIGSFKDNLNRDDLLGLFEQPFDFENIKSKAKHFVLIHSDNDPYCPLEHAQYLSQKLDGTLIVLKGQKHFSVGTMGEQYKEFPFLLKKILNNELNKYETN